MKKNLLSFLFILCMGGLPAQNTLFISEVADPGDVYQARFVELYNASGSAIDFDVVDWYLSKQSNGGSTWNSVKLTGTVADGGIHVIGRDNDFYNNYGFSPSDSSNSVINSNGDDAYYLYSGGDHTSGVLVDIYGAIDQDGTGEEWEFLDGRAYRNPGYKAAKTTWVAVEWTVEYKAADVADCDPFVHKADPDPEPDNHVTLFTVGTETFSRIPLTWTDATGTNLPNAYLVKAAKTGDIIADPVDGVIEVSGQFVKNIPVGTGSALFTSLDDKTGYTFKIFPYSNGGEFIDYKTDGTVPEVSGTTEGADTIVLFKDFEYELADWYTVSDSGDYQEWGLAMLGADNTLQSAYMNGFNYSGDVNEDWLFGPAVNLEAWSNEVLTFYNRWRYGTSDDKEYLKLFYSTDYNGQVGNHLEATWTEIPFDSAQTSETWFLTTDIDLSAIIAPNVHFAFKYRSTDNTRAWWVDEFMIKGDSTGETTPPVWKSGYPKSNDVRENQFDLVANINEPGNVYFLVKADGAPAPTILEVRMGDTLVVMNGGQDYSTTVDTVQIATSYDVYFIAEDAFGNVQDTTVKVDVMTLDPRDLALTNPVGGETFFVGDSLDVTWTSLNIDSIKLYVYGYEEMQWYDVTDTNILAAPGIFRLGVPLDAGLDSSYMKIVDAKDESFFDTSGIWYLTDTIVPVLDSVMPVNKTVDVPVDTDLSLYFNERMYPGSGYIIVKAEGGAYYDSIMTGSGQVTFDYNIVTVVLSKALMVGTKHSVLMDSAAFKDYQDNAADGISSDTVWTFTTVIPVEVANVAALRAATADNETLYKLTGEVVLTGQMDYRGRKYLQDATGAIEIDDNDLDAVTTVYNIGDGITGLTGTLEDYYGWLEIHPIVDPGTPSSTGNTITPKVVTIADFKANFDDHVAQLIRIDTVDLTKTGNFADGDQIDIARGTDTSILFVNFYSTDLTGSVIPEHANVTGIAYWHYSEAKIVPRFLADVEKVDIIPDKVGNILSNDMIRVYPNPNSGMFTFELRRDGISDLEIEIFSVNGKMVYRNAYRSVSAVREQIDLRDVARGMYILRVRTADNVSMSKLVIR